MVAARAAPAEKQRGEPGLGDPLGVRPPHTPPVLGYDCGPVRRAPRRVLFARRLFLLRKHLRVLQASRRLVSVADLWADLLLALQVHLDPWWNLAWWFMLPTLVPVTLWGDGTWDA